MLKLDKVSAYYGDVQILYDISLEVAQNEIVSLLGSNGAGKTTTVKAICNLLHIVSGTVSFYEKRLDTTPTYELAELGISLVPEGRKIFPGMTVRENLLLGAYILKDKKERGRNLEWVLEMFPRLRERSKQLAGTMSGGEQQMLAIARGLMIRPKLTIFDEPSLGLAPNIVDQIFETLSAVVQNGQSTILLIEQNAQLALEISDRAYVLENGHVTVSGSAKELLESEDIKKAYLGI